MSFSSFLISTSILEREVLSVAGVLACFCLSISSKNSDNFIVVLACSTCAVKKILADSAISRFHLALLLLSLATFTLSSAHFLASCNSFKSLSCFSLIVILSVGFQSL
jgi:hypothetical protein